MFNSNLTIFNIDYLTFLECEESYNFYHEKKTEDLEVFFKLFSFHNLESSVIANHGTESVMRNYINDLRRPKQIESNNIEDQFKEVGFGK